MKILGLIPARGGSKGVPGKNHRLLAGKSLVHRAFESATSSGALDRIILSTDDPEIARAARIVGIDVPFLRPAAIARDDTPMIEVAVHALDMLGDAGYVPEAVMLLQPTSPLRRSRHICDAVARLAGNDSVCSVVALPRELSPHYVMRIREDGLLDHFLPDGARYTRRQDVPRAYRRDGTIYLARTEVILVERNFYGKRCAPMLIPDEESLSIDDLDHWREAERRLLAGSASTVGTDR